MSKIMGLDAKNDRSALGGRQASQFLFRSTIQLKPGVRIDAGQYPCLDTRNFYPNKSLNRDYRVRELKRINEQNQSMLARIQSRQPYYDHKKWDAERKQDLKYLANIKSREVIGISQKFKNQASLPPLPHSPRSASRAGKTTTLRYDATLTPKASSPPATPAAAAVEA